MFSLESKFKILSSAFHHSEMIPKKYTPDGEDVNPPLNWENPPAETKSFALIVDDPDAPHGVFTHWMIKDISKNIREIKENSAILPGKEITNSWKIKKWKGPQPPTGTHRYFFKIFALNTEHIKANNLTEFYEEVQLHKIAEAQIMGKYSAKH